MGKTERFEVLHLKLNFSQEQLFHSYHMAPFCWGGVRVALELPCGLTAIR